MASLLTAITSVIETITPSIVPSSSRVALGAAFCKRLKSSLDCGLKPASDASLGSGNRVTPHESAGCGLKLQYAAGGC